jgi:hypothetical protein
MPKRAFYALVKPRFSSLLLCSLLTIFPYRSLMASLVICIYHNDELYVASDSCSTFVPKTGTVNDPVMQFQTKKIFKVTDTCCVSITGDFGMSLSNQITGQMSKTFLPNELENICSNLNLAAEPLQSDIATVISRFNVRYSDYVNQVLATRGNSKDINGTRICFWGYDGSTHEFFGSSCYFNGTNDIILEAAFDSASSPNYIGLQGEDAFLPSMIREPEKFAELHSDEFSKTIKGIYRGTPVSEESMMNCILEMFHLHKTYAAQMSSDKGWIGEPYMIYKIADKGLVNIH